MGAEEEPGGTAYWESCVLTCHDVKSLTGHISVTTAGIWNDQFLLLEHLE